MQKTILGYFIVCVGIALFIGGATGQLAVLEYVKTPVLTLGFPSGTQTEPTPLLPGATQKLWAVVLNCRSEPVSASCIVNGETYTLNVKLGMIDGAYEIYYSGWTVPELPEATMLEFVFTCNVDGFTLSASSWGKIGVPDGSFYINGELATTTSTHVVYDATLNIKFVATREGDKISRVYITVWNLEAYPPSAVGDKDLTETMVDSEWETTYTLPDYGTYEIYGYFVSETKHYRTMSIIMDLPGKEEPLNPTMLLGVATIGIGLVVVFQQRKREVKQ